MSEKMVSIIEKMLARLLYGAICGADARYPARGEVNADKAAHAKEVQEAYAWYASKMRLLYKASLKPASPPQRRPVQARPGSTTSSEDLILELIAATLAASWLIARVLVDDIRSAMTRMDLVVDVAASDPLRCLDELRKLAESLQTEANRGSKTMAANLTPKPSPIVTATYLIERLTKPSKPALMPRPDLMKKLLRPK